ncbi:MAG: hypothetical protein MUF71_06855 [Candidatus Kapabacteria bacterium]|jgi:DNA-binding NtrC family response regulator|nr:hypothetical protein [Candidatus Kapabacteria bacterium]
MQNHEQNIQTLILSNDEHIGATLRVLLASLSQSGTCAIVETASGLTSMLHHGLKTVFVDARELQGQKGKGLAQRVTSEAALIVIARDSRDAVLAFELEATDCISLPLLASRLDLALERAGAKG